MAASFRSLSLLAATALTLVMTSLPLSNAWQKDLKIEYYSNAILRCHENLTTVPNSKVFWITPGNVVVDESTPALPEHVALVNGSVVSMLNVTNVGDDQFGYYTCVMVDLSSSASHRVTLARWGLNVDGADFSKLEEEYRQNAIVGAVAASVMLVLVGGACLIWHYRYHKRRGDKAKGSAPSSGDSVDDDLKKPAAAAAVAAAPADAGTYVNNGYDNRESSSRTTAEVDIEMVETPKEPEDVKM